MGRLDVNPATQHVIDDGSHLNLETHINGQKVENIHISIDPSTVLEGDYP